MTNLLLPGQQLNINDQLMPSTGGTVLIMQGDGNLVLYRTDNGKALWASNTVWTTEHPVTHAIMQGDGNFVCYDASGNAHWSSNTWGNPGAYVIVQDDGNLVVYSSDNKQLWASNTRLSVLLAGQKLNISNQLMPPTGRAFLIMQSDGNLVLYRVDNGAALWASDTAGQPVTQAIMQDDGNFVCCDANGHPHWATGTDGNPGAWILLQDDGNLVVYSQTNAPLWASNTVQTWPIMSAIENVSLVREQSSPDIYLILGNTKFWITDPNEFNILGFDWSRVRIVADGTLNSFTEQRLHATSAIKPSDVFFDSSPVSMNNPAAGLCGDIHIITGSAYGNCKPSLAIVRKDVLIAGWLRQYSKVEPSPSVNTDGEAPGLEDVHYDLALDAVFLERMYGAGGLSTALGNAVWPGNIDNGDGTSRPAPASIPFATTPPLTPGGPRAASFNSWILPRNGPDVHPELNSWHVNDSASNFSKHFRGRGPQPLYWVNPISADNDAWFPFNPLDPEGTGTNLKAGDYVLMRGTLWQENNHSIGLSPWSSAPTVGHDGYTEMHPPDWIVRVREPNPNARLTTLRVAPASLEATVPDGGTIKPDFPPSSSDMGLQVRTVQRLVDLRFTYTESVVTLQEQRVAADEVVAQVVIQPTPTGQARFKGAWLVGWSEVLAMDIVWVDDQPPLGATLHGDNEGWDWQAGNVFTGAKAHRSALKQGMHRHYFLGATTPMVVNNGDLLFAMVFLDPDNPPDEIMLEWHTSDWLNRAYWGANLIDWGTNGTPERQFMGPLPPSGEWVRLSVPVTGIATGNVNVDGIAFTLFGGRAIWDYAGMVKSSIIT